MPQSFSQVILHIVFSTKERRPWLDPEIRPRMHALLRKYHVEFDERYVWG